MGAFRSRHPHRHAPWFRPGRDGARLSRCLLLAALLHLALVLVMGSAPPGSARPGEGVWGRLSLVLSGVPGPSVDAPSALQGKPGPVGDLAVPAPRRRAQAARTGLADAAEATPLPGAADHPPGDSLTTVQADEGHTPMPAGVQAPDEGSPPATPGTADEAPAVANAPMLAPPSPAGPPDQTLVGLVAPPLPEAWPLNERVPPAPVPAAAAAPATTASAPPVSWGTLAMPAAPPASAPLMPPPAQAVALPAMAPLPEPLPPPTRWVQRLAQPAPVASATAQPLVIAPSLRLADAPLPVPAAAPLPTLSRRAAALAVPKPVQADARPLTPPVLTSLPPVAAAPERLPAVAPAPEQAATRAERPTPVTLTAPAPAASVAAGPMPAGALQASAPSGVTAGPLVEGGGSPAALAVTGIGTRVGLDGAVAGPTGVEPVAGGASGPAPLNLGVPGGARAGISAGRALPGILPWVPRPPERKTPLSEAVEQSGRPDCRTAYNGAGLLAVVPLLADAARDKGCRW